MDPRELRKERRRDQVREEILEATRTVLLKKGLAGLTLSAVAREVHLTKAALYHYFPSKEALVFERIYLGLAGHAETVERAVSASTSGAEAIEALIRASTDHYAHRLDELRLAYLMPQIGTAGTSRAGAEMLERIRPFNDRIYGTTAEKIRVDQQAGRIAADIDGRRLAFLAHMAVIGLLTMQGLVEVVDEAPLIHDQGAMVDDLVRTFRARLSSTD